MSDEFDLRFKALVKKEKKKKKKEDAITTGKNVWQSRPSSVKSGAESDENISYRWSLNSLYFG